MQPASIVLLLKIISSFIALSLGDGLYNLGIADEAYCEARPTLVHVDDPDFRYLPKVVTLHRCGGSFNRESPNRRRCVSEPGTETIVKLNALLIEAGRQVVLNMINHTNCTSECVVKKEDCDSSKQTWDSQRCECTCNKLDSICPKNKRWSHEKCQCTCEKGSNVSCPKNKVWNSDLCACVCDSGCEKCSQKQQIFHEESCTCIDPPKVERVENDGKSSKDGIRKEVFYGVIAAEFFILFAVFELLMYPKKAGFIYKLKQKCIREKDDAIGPKISYQPNKDENNISNV